MAPDEADRLSAPFDEMLKTSRRELDALYRGEGGEPSRPMPLPARAAPRTAPSAGFDPISTPTARVLDDWFGAHWRFEITDRRHDGDDVVVSGRVVIEDQGIEMSGIGRAAVARTRVSAPIEGTTAGIGFKVEPAQRAASRDSVGDSEDSAFHKAAAAALARCAQLP